jgi:hypothetical protein
MQGLVTDAPAGHAADILLAKNMAETLHKHYPNHMWAVTCDGDTGLATVRNLALSGNWGFVLKIPAIYSASEFAKDVMRAGGEILERYKLSRGGMNFDHYDSLQTDHTGNHIHY